MNSSRTQLYQAVGYHIVLLPPALLVAGACMRAPWLAFLVLFALLPLMRMVFGEVGSSQPDWTETVATELEFLPALACAVFVLSVAVLAWSLGRSTGSVHDLLGGCASLWMTSLLASCVAHEALHRRNRVSRFLGRLSSGALGYPLLEGEHAVHHWCTRWAGSAECARQSESLWSFTLARLVRAASMAYQENLTTSLRHGSRLAGGLWISVSTTVLTASAFAALGGRCGLAVYLVSSASTAWSIQATTFIQHWAMGDADSRLQGGAECCWEDRCQVQAWITLNISFHQAHHRSSTVSYYRLTPSPEAPRQPAGYLIMLLVAMVPRAWRALMVPALRRWKRAPSLMQGPGRALICFTGADPQSPDRL